MAKTIPKSIGLDMFHTARLTKDERGSALPVYGSVVEVPGAINCSVQPQTSSLKFYYDNGLGETFVSTSNAQVSIEAAGLAADTELALLGHDPLEAAAIGMVGDFLKDPELVAFGYRRKFFGTVQGGRPWYRYVWLLKQRFTLPNEENSTKAEQIAVATPKLTAEAMALESFLPNKQVWRYSIDNSLATVTERHEELFFSAVFWDDAGLSAAVAAAVAAAAATEPEG